MNRHPSWCIGPFVRATRALTSQDVSGYTCKWCGAVRTTSRSSAPLALKTVQGLNRPLCTTAHREVRTSSGAIAAKYTIRLQLVVLFSLFTC